MKTVSDAYELRRWSYIVQAIGGLVILLALGLGPAWARWLLGLAVLAYLLAPIAARWSFDDELRGGALAVAGAVALWSGGWVLVLIGFGALLAFGGNLLRKRADDFIRAA